MRHTHKPSAWGGCENFRRSDRMACLSTHTHTYTPRHGMTSDKRGNWSTFKLCCCSTAEIHTRCLRWLAKPPRQQRNMRPGANQCELRQRWRRRAAHPDLTHNRTRSRTCDNNATACARASSYYAHFTFRRTRALHCTKKGGHNCCYPCSHSCL